MYSFSYLEPVCCSMSSSNCCFLTCIQISQGADQVVWYFHLFQNFPQFSVIHSNTEEAEVEQFYEDLQGLLELTPKKRYLFHYRELECKSRKSRNTWSNRQIWLWSTEWSRAKDNRVLPRECTGHNKHLLPRTQEKMLDMDITRWSTP